MLSQLRYVGMIIMRSHFFTRTFQHVWVHLRQNDELSYTYFFNKLL